MSTTHIPAPFAAELPEITRADIARFVKEGRRRRAEETVAIDVPSNAREDGE